MSIGLAILKLNGDARNIRVNLLECYMANAPDGCEANETYSPQRAGGHISVQLKTWKTTPSVIDHNNMQDEIFVDYWVYCEDTSC